MEAALYDPENGYYTRRAAIGDGGDFVTSPAISPLFARAIARTLAADAATFAGEIVFCEAASGSGAFLRDFRAALAALDPEVSARTRLWAIERSEAGRHAIAGAGLAERIAEDVAELAGARFDGWVFSNELYDALPVHRVMRSGGRLVELGVKLSPDGAAFGWAKLEAKPELSDYLARFGVELAEGQTAEINLEAAPLHRTLARLVGRGRIVAFDYGHRAPILYHSHARRSGTLAVHSGGRRGGDPLERPGEVDLTAHVNWDDLERAGESEGFVTGRRMRQSEFLVAAGLFQDAPGRREEAMRLVDPEGIGDALSVLVQSRGMPGAFLSA
jgi:SAM-dependent MidA family methyltransferase